MSAGHRHRRPNYQAPTALRKLLTQGGALDLASRWQRIDVDHDIPDLAGYNWAGTVRYLDRDIFHALLEPAFAEHIGIGQIDTGLTPDQTIDCIMQHESVEKVLIDADNDLDTYQAAHEYATIAEHELVRKLGGSPLKYERGLAKAIKFCEAKTPHAVPVDLDCAPIIDDPDKDDRRVAPLLHRQGVEDIVKKSKEAVDYSRATGDDQCQRCSHWQPVPQEAQFGLARCELVCGLVRADRWCREWSGGATPRKIDATSGQGDGTQGESDVPRDTLGTTL